MIQTSQPTACLASDAVVLTVSLKPDLFEGLKFDFSKPLNMNFAVTHR